MDMSSETALRVLVGQRIAHAVDTNFPSRVAAAEALGMTTEGLRKWINGTVKVPLEGIRRLAKVSRTDMAWLCGIDIPKPPTKLANGGVMPDVLTDVLRALATVIASDGVHFMPDRFAELVIALHDWAVDQRVRSNHTPDLAGLADVIRLSAHQ